MRLRRTEYAPGQLTAWANAVEKQAWSDAYVFFKHEDEGRGRASRGVPRAAS